MRVHAIGPCLLTEDEVKQLLKAVDSTELSGVVDEKMIVFMLALTGWARIVKSLSRSQEQRAVLIHQAPA